MYLQRHTEKWWFEPKLQKPRVRVPKYLHSLDPCSNSLPHKQQSRVGGFQNSRHWIRYNRLHSVEVGYITPLYDLSAIARRYGLSEAGKRYFKQNILPEPFDIVRRRSVQAHHWSRFTLMVMDVVLADLECRGYLQLLKSFEDHVTLLHTGVDYLQEYYAARVAEKETDLTDKYGVEWL